MVRQGTGRAMRGERGASMIELMIVVAIVGLLYVILSNAYQGWAEKYRVESAVKEMFADLMDARGRALQTNRAHFVLVTTTTTPARYHVFADTSPAPDGNGTYGAGDTWVRSRTVQYRVTLAPATVTAINFNRDGLLSTNGGTAATIRLTSPVASDYDCINLGPTRIKMGRFDETWNRCVER